MLFYSIYSNTNQLNRILNAQNSKKYSTKQHIVKFLHIFACFYFPNETDIFYENNHRQD
jgi:hypothetical protein